MDDEYLDSFIHEAEEEITTLNNSLLDLESDPDDQEAMDRIFRTAHTLKGNFGAMGFEDAADLAHALEDLLDEMRQGELAVTPDVMDLVFAGVDEIEALVDEIEADGETDTDPRETVERLRTVLEEGAEAAGDGSDAAEVPEGAAEGTLTPDADEVPVDPDGVDGLVVRADVDLGETEMPGVDAMFALEGIEGAFDVLATVPDREAVEGGEFDGRFSAFLDASDVESVATELDVVPKVADAAVSDVSDDFGTGSSAAEADHAVDEISSVRVEVDQLDDLHGQVEQLVTSRIKLRRAVEDDDLDGAEETLSELDKITANLQNTVMDMRLIPLKKVVGKFPRLVRDLSRELDKDVDFAIEGEDIELDRTILTEISDPLMHILRNAVDHGIEPPEEREAAGKPRTGRVELRASRERDHVIIEVTDDGAGLDVDAIRSKAIETGVRSPDELEAMDPSAVYDLVFHPGFSTAEEVTDTSGRGVGMDVVHDTVTQLDGSVSVDSTPGEGTTVRLRLPVTMAIVKVLFVQVGEEEYGVPIKNVDEITGTDEVQVVDGREVIKHDGELYPVIDLGEAFEVPGRTAAATDGGTAADGASSDAGAGAGPGDAVATAETVDGADLERGGEGMLVRIRASERQVALRCDAVNSQEEVVVKPLEGILSGTPGLSGTAVLGDGNIVHILDVVTL